MKTKIIIVFLTLLTLNTYAYDPKKSEEAKLSIQAKEQIRKAEIRQRILELFKLKALEFTPGGELIFTDESNSIIEELKEKGLFEEINTMDDKSICI